MNIEAILQNADLRDLVTKAGGNPDRTGHSVCPLHGGDNPYGFHIYKKEGRELWNCFSGSCGGGDVITFVEVWRGWDFKMACEFLGGDKQSDPVEMKRLADERHEREKIKLAEQQARTEAARKELQVAERHLYYHNGMKQWAREMWTGRGIDEGMQDFWKLGACEDFVINDGYHTPTLTIPIIGEDMQLLNIKHRLVNPQKPKDKYRPETSGLGAFPPFLAVPEMGYNDGLIIITEGEIKAMVTWEHIDNSDIQVIGVPGRSQFKAIAEKIGGKNVVVIPDPGAEKEAYDFAKLVKGRYLPMNEKIDDYILQTKISANDLYAMFKQSRKV